MAHSIKGLAATLGASPLEREAASIESALATEGVDTGTILVASLDERLAALQKLAPENLP